MAGLIDKTMQPEAEAPEGSAPDMREDAAEGAPEGTPANEREDAQEGQGGDLSPEGISDKIKMPPELQNAYERVLVAGMKLMFDPQSHEIALQQLQGEGPAGPRLGKAIAGLLTLLFKESNQTMPPQVMIPAGTELLVRAADFLKQSGTEQITDADIGEALTVMIDTLLTGFGLDPEKVLAAGYDASAVPEQPGGLVDKAAGNLAEKAAPPSENEGATEDAVATDDAENPLED